MVNSVYLSRLGGLTEINPSFTVCAVDQHSLITYFLVATYDTEINFDINRIVLHTYYEIRLSLGPVLVFGENIQLSYLI